MSQEAQRTARSPSHRPASARRGGLVPAPAGARLRRVPGIPATLALAVALLGGLGCRTSGGPGPEVATTGEVRAPVVLVPGITGVALRDRETGELAWGSGTRLVFPRDHGWGFALPLVPGRSSDLVPGRVLREIRLGPIRKPIYQPVIDALVRGGYRLGDLDDPRPGETLFLFAYDWRRSNVDSARALGERLVALGRALGAERLPVDLICQSNGTYVCRWLARYGTATLEEAEAGRAGPGSAGGPEGFAVRRIVLAGTANGGSTRMFRELLRGRRYLPLGRTIRPETLFTFPSFFQDLPVADRELFVDGEGRELDRSLRDPDHWTGGGWSIFSPAAERRISRSPRGRRIFGTEADRVAHLVRELERAGRFHRLLRRDAPGFVTERYCSIQSRARDTPAGALVAGPARKPTLHFAGDRLLRRHPRAAERITAPGDLHATVTSQGWLAPQEEAVLGETTWVDGDHFELILEPVALEALLACLRGAAEPLPAPAPSGR